MSKIFLLLFIFLPVSVASTADFKKMSLPDGRIIYFHPIKNAINSKTKNQILTHIDLYLSPITQKKKTVQQRVHALYQLKGYTSTIYKTHKHALTETALYGSIATLFHILKKLPKDKKQFLADCQKKTDQLILWINIVTEKTTKDKQTKKLLETLSFLCSKPTTDSA